MKRVKVSPEELKNGWTDKTLNAYLLERERASFQAVYNKKPTRPSVQNHKYNPFRHWR